MNEWFLTKNNQVLRRYQVKSAWLEHIPTREYVLYVADLSDIEWNCASFDVEIDGIEYMKEIYEWLSKK